MSSGTDLRVSRSLELLGNLRQTAAAFAQREEQINRELKGRRLTTDRGSQQAISDAESRHATQAAEIEGRYQKQKKRIQSIYEGRRNRVQKYQAITLKNLPRRAEEVKQSWIGTLQMRSYQEQRKLTANMAAADAVYTGFIAQMEELRLLYKHARKSFGGYWSLRRRLRARPKTAPPTDLPLEEQLSILRSYIKTAQENLDQFDQFTFPRIFRFVRLSLVFLLCAAGGAGAAWYFGFDNGHTNLIAGGSAAGVFIVFWIIHAMTLQKPRPFAVRLAGAIVASRQIIDANGVASPDFVAQRDANRKVVQDEYERSYAEVLQQWGRADDVKAEYEERTRHKIEAQSARIYEKIDRLLGPRIQQIEARHAAEVAQLNQEAATGHEKLVQARASQTSSLGDEEKIRWNEMETDWHRQITPIYRAIEEMNAAGDAISPAWNSSFVENWIPPGDFAAAAKFGRLSLDLTRPPGGIPQSPRLALPGPAQVSVPAALAFPYQGSILFETGDSGHATVAGALNNIILRLLSTNPPGKVSFTIIDPVRLGQNFAGLMYLADYQESIINRRIWTQRDQIEERLAEMSEHIEKVIQMYLRNEYATITEYNRQAGSVAEKYHFLVIADFPANFSETSAKRLQSIGASGPRCGIFTLMHWDQRQPAPDGFVPEEFRKNSICIRRTGNEFAIGKEQAAIGATLDFDEAPNPDLALSLVHHIGKYSVDSNRVEVPFLQIAPKPEEMWTGDTTSELRVAIGRTGATKLQYLAIGKGTKQHALFAGKTGSGKSTLFHVIITNLALECSPEQVEFYLIDFKKGVEFKCYATKHLPHAKVVAIESDREFALSVLQRVDAELRRRGDLFRKLGVQDIPGYRKSGGTEPMPRSLLIIDEFQEFFVEDDTIAQSASLLFDRIVRQGRAFGIHVLLGSQTLGGAYSLARATIGQMVIRVALQCNEADSYLIMDENNSAPRLLSRPGEGIYNDAAGALEGNSPFQVVWLPDDERDLWLDKVQELAAQHAQHEYPSPIVFEGNAPANIRENELFRSVLETAPVTAPVAGRIWLGSPNSIKGPTEAAFHRQSGNHLLIVGQREEAALTMLGNSLLALAAQYPKGTAKFVLFQSAPPGTPEASFLDYIVHAMPHPIVAVHANGIPAAMNDLAAELQARSSSEANIHEAPAIFLLIHGLHKFKKLRNEDDFSFSSGGGDAGLNAGAQLGKLISEGSGCGMHIITTIDTLNSVNHFMSRKALSEFEMRVIFQMSANDSASLIDSPKASTLGLHRAFFYNEHEGYLETFRPYAYPDAEWLGRVAEILSYR
ncbi:MAG TPA: FtsK/SpoIIIE domain-containing protein [Candidatus Methylacidiphilales bacterium]|nr:FtsK/SpoIIIE domain-containing protein [Candidatus Methylacidiphilales bacterium]